MSKSADERGLDMTIPFEYMIWDAQECADYLRQSRSTFLKRTQWAPDFPPRTRGEGHPRWNAKQVTMWANQNVVEEV